MHDQDPSFHHTAHVEASALKRLALNGAFWSAAEGWGRQLASLAIFVFVARLLSPVDMGLFAMVVIVLAALQTVLDEGLNEVLVQRHDLEPLHLDTAFWSNVLLSGALCLGVSLLSVPISRLFGEPALAPLISVASAAPLLVGLSGVQQALLRRQLKYRTLAVRSVTGVVAGGIVGLVLAARGYGAWALVLQQVVDRLVGAAVLWASTEWRPRFRFSRKHGRDLAAYSGFMTCTRMVNFCSKQVDRYMVAVLMGPALLGVYTLAFRVNDTLGYLVVQGLATVGLSTFSRLQQDLDRMRRALYAAAELSWMVAAPVFLGICAVAPNLVVVTFGERWVDSGPILMVIALLGLPGLVSTYAGAILRATNRTGLLLSLLIFSAVANVAVVLVAVPYGLLAVAIAIVLRNVAFVPLYLYLMKKLVGANPLEYVRRMLPGLSAAIAMALTVWVAGHALAPQLSVKLVLAAQIGLGIATYPLFLAVLAPAALGRAIEAYRHWRGTHQAPAAAQSATP
jgi:O-antigen/teichoic acid export membrane protein